MPDTNDTNQANIALVCEEFQADPHAVAEVDRLLEDAIRVAQKHKIPILTCFAESFSHEDGGGFIHHLRAERFPGRRDPFQTAMMHFIIPEGQQHPLVRLLVREVADDIADAEAERITEQIMEANRDDD